MPIKQYVNLNPKTRAQLDGLAKARAGTKVVVEATVNPAKGGVLVTFTMKNGAGNAKSANRSTKLTGKTDGNGKATATFELSTKGGDEFTITPSYKKNKAERATELPPIEYVVWRRLYCEISRFAAGTPGDGQLHDALPEVPELDFQALKDKAATYYLELVDKSTNAIIPRRLNVVDKEQHGSQARVKAFAEGADASRDPVGLRIVVVHQIACSSQKSFEQSKIGLRGKTKLSLPDKLWTDASCDKDKDWFVGLAWKWTTEEGWQTLDSKWIARTGDKEVEVDIGSAGLANSEDDAREVDLQLTYRALAKSTNGRQNGHAFIVAASHMGKGPREAAAITNTALHELGHALGMVPASQESHYDEHGHTGDHCSTGLASPDLSRPDYHGLPGTCVMFGEGGAARTGDYCDLCTKAARAAKAHLSGFVEHTW